MIVLDTNVLSEAVRPQPDEAVMRWLRFAPGDDLFTTAITEAEMRYGAARLPAGRNRREREAQIDHIFQGSFCGLHLALRHARGAGFSQCNLVHAEATPELFLSRCANRGDCTCAWRRNCYTQCRTL